MHHSNQDRQAQQKLSQTHGGLREQQFEVAERSLARQDDEQSQANDYRWNRKKGVEQQNQQAVTEEIAVGE
jgi:hypothetical protein